MISCSSSFEVAHYHNVKLMRPVSSPNAAPYVVPYDFNNAGVVNAPYALPQEILGIESVRERLYRGFPRTMEELEKVIEIFLKKKTDVWALVNNCAWLNNKYKKEVLGYMESFYKVIESKSLVKYTFIDNARTN